MDRQRLTPEQQDLVVAYYHDLPRMVNRFLRSFPWARHLYDELASEANLALIRAVQRHTEQSTLSGYIYTAVWRRLKSFLLCNAGVVHIPEYLWQRNANYQRPDEEPVDCFPGGGDTLPSREPDPAILVEEEEDRQAALHWLHRGLAALPPRDCLILRRRYGLGCEPEIYATIAQDLGITRQRTEQLASRAQDNLQMILMKPGASVGVGARRERSAARYRGRAVDAFHTTGAERREAA